MEGAVAGKAEDEQTFIARSIELASQPVVEGCHDGLDTSIAVHRQALKRLLALEQDTREHSGGGLEAAAQPKGHRRAAAEHDDQVCACSANLVSWQQRQHPDLHVHLTLHLLHCTEC